ncbi:AAA family ATPase [Candidatus Falkowbacteria bacterium]|jgi:wobble nucleotide-excising tRNase|nr:AAA family ATPase [Candidatus Falkowbacteria bacterium]MBT4433326.1 AAA family ATPase [Candidatus Falkowbacteria bacterium]
MIKKLKTINNIFSYSFFEWDTINPVKGVNPNDPIDIFKKNNILFAENGNGKTNLINLLKVLNGVDSIKLEKHWDYPTENQNVVLELDNELSFNSGNWSEINGSLQDKFVIFDKYFTEKYVHSVGLDHHNTAQRKQERGKHIIYLGNFTEYNQEINKINRLKNEVSEKNSAFWTAEQDKISNILPEWLDITKIDSEKNIIKNIDPLSLSSKQQTLENQKKNLEKVINAIKNQSEIEKLKNLDDIKTVFDFKIKEFDKNGKKTVYQLDPAKLFNFTVSKGVKQTLSKISNKKSFIKTGLNLVDDTTEDCPFCEQKIKNGELIQIVKDYQNIFDQTFLDEESKVKNRLQKYKTVLSSLKDLQSISSNVTSLQEAQKYVGVDISIPNCSLGEEDKKIIELEIQRVIDKEKNILNPVTGSTFEQIKNMVDRANALKKSYNNAVDKINEKINELKKVASEGKLDERKTEIENTIRELEKSILYINHQKDFLRYFNAKNHNNQNKKVIENLEAIYQKLKEKIVEKFNKFANEYFELIKHYVKIISPSMEIFDVLGKGTYSRTGREPAQCGFEVQYNKKDCTNDLSEGERQVIALAFFFAQLKKEISKDKIIILDDPITSFDAGKRKSTAEVIKSETQKFDQLFVFTCDPLFREFCLKEIPNRNFYYIFITKKSSSIHYVPKNRETIYQSFEEDFKNIGNINGSNENVVIYGQKLRFCLETKIKEDYFGYSQDNLSNMIEQVVEKGNQKFKNLIDNKETILNLYNYCNTGGLAHYPKDGSTSWNELNSKVQEYLNLNL